MKISAIKVYQSDLPLVEGRYSWSEGKYVEVFDSTVVELIADNGLAGYGEVCPLGPFYLPAFGAGARAGIGELAPHLMGADPTAIGPINQLMDKALLGHPYVKSAIDMACWDLSRQSSPASRCAICFGGRFGDSVALYRAISQRPADEMAENVAGYRAEGYTKFQLKVGGEPQETTSIEFTLRRTFWTMARSSLPTRIRAGASMMRLACRQCRSRPGRLH